ncbi:hypothetical protein Tco_0330790 [Tanacetum coccineum]
MNEVRHVTIVHQTKDLHTTDYTQLYDFLKYNQKEVDDQRAERLAKTHDPLALMANSNNPFNYPCFHTRSTITKGISLDSSRANVVVNKNGYNAVLNVGNSGTAQSDQRGGMLLIFRLIVESQKENQNPSPSWKSLIDGCCTEVHNYDNCYDNEIFNMFTQEEQYTDLLEPIPEPHQVQQNDSNVIPEISSVEQEGGTVDQHPATVEETCAYFESLYNNLALEVEKVNSVNRKMKETNADLTTELARYKNQEKCFEKYDKLERCYQKSVYHEQCLTKKINALHLSSGKQITTLNEEISNLSKQLSTEKSTVSSLLEEKKKLKSDFKIREDELLDKQIQLENKIKELDNILVKTASSAKQQSLYKRQSVTVKSMIPLSVWHDSEETLQLAQEISPINETIEQRNKTGKLYKD